MSGQFDTVVRSVPHQDQQAGHSFFIVQTSDTRDGYGYNHDVYHVEKLLGEWPPASVIAHAVDSASFGGGYTHYYGPPSWTVDRATIHVYTD